MLKLVLLLQKLLVYVAVAAIKAVGSAFLVLMFAVGLAVVIGPADLEVIVPYPEVGCQNVSGYFAAHRCPRPSHLPLPASLALVAGGS